ncbi:CheR family methyltransferase [Leptospira idonii]|uniref:CheR-type methyltransferase domain-containing protein n=1 Tax=Leptospira idonii TaxID=1193500 RepID=A0A4R9LVT9_9LEPT|nr:CheR family methyltransferase [Leptospira idonii]TGN18320.1 hypothetical protein EHS15_13015 [Leptospira idonii]
MDPYYQELSDVLLKKAGIRIDSPEKWDLIRNHFNESQFKSLIRDPSPSLWAELFRTLNISETYFHRDPVQLKAIFGTLIPEYLKLTGKTHLHVWSAGCSTGEEAYTLSCMLEILSEKRALNSYLVVGTDIQSKSLEIAKKGVYSNYSVRNHLPEGMEEYLIRDANQVSVHSAIKNKTLFFEKNLLEPMEETFDLIVCRNVFIYLENDAKESILENFSKSLFDGGIIVLGHAEHSGALPENLSSHSISGETSYFKKGTRIKNPQSSLKENFPSPKETPSILKQETKQKLPLDPILSLPQISLRPEEKKEPKPTARESALLEKNRANYEQAHFFWKQVLYEDPDSVEAYYELSNYFWEKGDRKMARSYQAQAQVLLKNDPAKVDLIKKRGNWVSEWDDFLSLSL